MTRKCLKSGLGKFPGKGRLGKDFGRKGQSAGRVPWKEKEPVVSGGPAGLAKKEVGKTSGKKERTTTKIPLKGDGTYAWGDQLGPLRSNSEN